MKRNKYLNTFETTADYNNYIESALPEFPNVGLTKDDDKLHYMRTSPNDHQIWGTTTATENFNIKLNDQNVEVTVDPLLGEFYLTGWTGTLTSLAKCFYNLSHITSIKKFTLDTSNVTSLMYMFRNCSNITYINLTNINTTAVTNISGTFQALSSLTTLDLTNVDLSNATTIDYLFNNTSNVNVYINVEGTLMKLTNNLSSSSWPYLSGSSTIHYDNGSEVIDYKWQNNAWTPQS